MIVIARIVACPICGHPFAADAEPLPDGQHWICRACAVILTPPAGTRPALN